MMAFVLQVMQIQCSGGQFDGAWSGNQSESEKQRQFSAGMQKAEAPRQNAQTQGMSPRIVA
jgi:hypothetical protein